MADGGPSRKNVRLGASSRLNVSVVHHSAAWRSAGVTDAALARAARAAFAVASGPSSATYEASLLLTDDAEMRTLNATWRGLGSGHQAEIERMLRHVEVQPIAAQPGGADSGQAPRSARAS